MKRASLPLALALTLAATCGTRAPRPVQPIEFNHQLHAGKHEIGCSTCHAGAERRPAAGLPSLATCLSCHMKPQGEQPSAAEGRVRELAGAGAPVRWVQVTRNPGHVFFSHAAHVSLGGMTCSRCHGDVTRWRTPPVEPEARLRSMSACQSCHREEGGPLGCATCHR